jgi:hypothetical protein
MASTARLDTALRHLLRSRRFWIWAGVLPLVALALATLPLLNILGFEFALVMALLGSLAGADLAATLVRRARAGAPDGAEPTTASALVGGLFLRAAAASLLVLLPPALLISLNGLRVRTCDWGFGVLAYGGLAGLSALAGAAAGIAAAILCGPRRRLGAVLPWLVVLGWLAQSVRQFYAEPPVFVYNAFGGYFPGNLYDESLSLSATFVWARLFQAATGVAVLAVIALCADVPTISVRLLAERRPSGPRPGCTVVATAAAVAAAVLWFRSARLGFAVDAKDIQAELGGRHETAHFVIYYPQGADFARDIALIAADHEFRYAQVTRTFGAAPPGKIRSYYFANPAQKRRWFGAEHVHMAKPWRREIFVHHDAFPHSVLRHEIAHAVAGAFGDPWFHVAADRLLGAPVLFNVGLIEGAAVAADWPGRPDQTLTPHEAVAAMRELGFAPPIERLLSTGFFAFSAARSYTAAGSFVRFLLDEHGPDRFRTLYASGGDFRAAYGQPREVLVAEWLRAIDAIPLPPGTAEKVRESFRRGALFERPCPHDLARLSERAKSLAARGDRAAAITTLRSICAEDPGEPRHRLDLADLLAQAEHTQEATALYREMAEDTTLSSTLRGRARLALADHAGRAGDFAEVLRQLDAAAALPLPDDDRRQVVARRLAAAHAGPAGPSLRAYFWRRPPDRDLDLVVLAARAAASLEVEPDLALAHYLLGRVLFLRDAFADAAPRLARAATLGLPDVLLARENARLLCIAAYRAGDLHTAAVVAAALAAADQPAILRHLGADWQERIAWQRAQDAITRTERAP